MRVLILSARHDYRAASSKIDSQLYKLVYEIWKDRAAAAQESAGATMTFVLQHIPKNVIDIGNKHGGNALGLESIAQQCECGYRNLGRLALYVLTSDVQGGLP
jgi:cephalosporin hydroxylase